MTRRPLDVNAAARLSGNVQLVDVACVGLNAAFVNPGNRPQGKTLGWDFPDPTGVWKIDGTTLAAYFGLDVFIHVVPNDESDQPQQLAEFNVKFRLEYELKPGAEWPEADVPHYVGITGLLHLWPYLRAEIQALTTKLGLPPLVLPVIVSGHAAEKVTVKRARAERPDKAQANRPGTARRSSKPR